MNIPTSLTRSTLTVVVPGIVAVAPWALALVQHTDATLGFDHYPTLAHTIFFAAVIVAGTLCEGLGTYLETFWDKNREEKLQVKDNWYAYLSTRLEREPVGYRYLSRLVTAMYFELAMLFAVPSFVLGAALLGYLRFSGHGWLWIAAALIGVGGSVAFFAWQAYTTHGVICETRQKIMSCVAAT